MPAAWAREVHGEQKQGASYRYTRQLGYYPLAALRRYRRGAAPHIRNAKAGHTQRGAARFVDALLACVRRAGHTGPIVIRADSGFENHKLIRELTRRAVEFSIGVKQSQKIRALIDQIPEADWVTICDYPELGRRRSPKPGSGTLG